MSQVTNNTNPFKPGNQLAKGHGAPKGNTNSQTHGLRTTTLGRLPDVKIQRQGYKFRRWLEELTVESHGLVSATHELAINSATRHEISALLIARWLRINGENMTHDVKLKYLTALGKESDLRDKAVGRLKLDRDVGNVIDSLYSTATAMDYAEDGNEV